jgi:hypothetical protein
MAKYQVIGLCAGLAMVVAVGLPAADWRDLLKGAVEGVGKQSQSAGVDSLTATEMNAGLKEALAVGVERAVNALGRSGGYLDDPSVRIPLPGMLAKSESALRMMGQGAVVDEFITTANRAAEQAVPQAAAIVGKAVRAMTIADAKTILTGPDDAATQYFRAKTSEDLTAAMLPIVRRATDSAGVTRAYKNLVGKAGAGAGLIGASLDVDAYVTEKTLDGLFLKVADEEKQIRTNPVARTSDLLKKVFGAAAQ